MNIPGKVRRLYHRDRLSLSEIERRTGLARKTTRNWLKAPEGAEPKYRRQIGESKIAPYPTQSHEMLFDAHTRAFAAPGGIPRRGIYGNMKTAADKVKKGKSRIANTRFAAMASHYLFDPDFCNVASGREKGAVEKNVRDSRRRI